MEQPFIADETADEERLYGHLRSEPRDSMFLMAAMRRADGQEITVKVRNLSAGGMMAECPVSLSRGETIAIDLRGIGTVAGTIAWTAGGRIGIAFAGPVDPRLARKPIAASGPQPNLVKPSRSMWRPGLR